MRKQYDTVFYLTYPLRFKYPSRCLTCGNSEILINLSNPFVVEIPVVILSPLSLYDDLPSLNATMGATIDIPPQEEYVAEHPLVTYQGVSSTTIVVEEPATQKSVEAKASGYSANTLPMNKARLDYLVKQQKENSVAIIDIEKQLEELDLALEPHQKLLEEEEKAAIERKELEAKIDQMFAEIHV